MKDRNEIPNNHSYNSKRKKVNVPSISPPGFLSAS